MNLVLELLAVAICVLVPSAILYYCFQKDSKPAYSITDDAEKKLEEHATKPEVFEHSYDLQLLFLAREGALEKFENNTKCGTIKSSTGKPYIFNAFVWDDSPEGG